MGNNPTWTEENSSILDEKTRLIVDDALEHIKFPTLIRLSDPWSQTIPGIPDTGTPLLTSRFRAYTS